jgi:hypothetical protein
MEKESSAGLALRQSVCEHGIPERMTSDGASKQTRPETEFEKIVRKYDIEQHVSEPP